MINSLDQTICQQKLDINKPKFTVDDWYRNNKLRFYCSEAQKKLAQQVLDKSDKVCEFTTETVINNKNETNHCLEERINEIEFCKNELARSRDVLPLEIDALETYKNRLQASLSSLKQNALDICKKCLSARECRIGIDLVNDVVEVELRKECEKIKCAERLLSQSLRETQEQLRRLKSSLYYLDRDLEDKENNLRIDRYNSTLRESSLNLSIYRGTCSLEISKITNEEWQSQTKKNIDASKEEVQNALKYRAYIDHILKRILDDLINQKKSTDEAFKRRIKETKEIKEKLEIQHSEVMTQANAMSRNITKLEKTIAEKEGFIALVHTRLGNRCQRPTMELTRDNVEQSLTKELSELRDAVVLLQQTLYEAQATLRYLLKIQVQLEEDINVKTNTLNIDEVHCISMRQSIDYRVF
ncbi:hypothetical protein QAD02_016104 [Eretmocerus hayati]|uniref:Uncharacterized protein n=1 Tax=Eretmocerus hayati TaxID=131215 RepID=A0ACC2PAH8_9HYME|nr:hypothetical protein QAD02_016104 [Eretmocerus hayati]